MSRELEYDQEAQIVDESRGFKVHASAFTFLMNISVA